jgi:hypothetical protein
LVLLGGKAGKADGLNFGAQTAYLSDLEVTESLDAFLLSVISEGLSGGSAGDVADGARGGNLGPRELGELCVEVLGGRLGRDVPAISFAEVAYWRKL